ncbi:acyltransferase domain-containing protein [Catenulispora sp. NF23]|uniref:[acyl-carrier-protein] S-malonyltransferase n=1 Tax=Catenulispora pinistramenti TaxID=2705254 RepID=A0ABS5L4X4_9ACTN|nr:acyltransferase domain-containing protein [Catenulispora pinistramenti]MBS2537450.1 acyltransferase domain-containing protein [Catenulispora pinistramenti]MBS2553277.1 acyltransferase domain-containing protein [Catenulispora pinistramenti]
MLVLVAPGQGAQTPGFLTPWLEVPGFADRLTWWSAVSGLDLVHYGTEADAEAIKDTAIAQPLLVAAGIASALALFPHPSDAYSAAGRVGAVGGHSVGEIAAAAGAGVISAESAMVFVRERGRLMAQAAAVTPTGMTAVLGGDRDEVLAKIAEHHLIPANNNGAGQIVAAGTLEDLARFGDDGPAGARLRALSVAGAFHTQHMGSAVEQLAKLAKGITTRDPRTRLVSNADGAVVHDGREVLRRLVAQVSNPVRWDLCMETFADLGATGILEVSPAGTLTGLAKRALKGVQTFALKTPDNLDAAREFIAEHAEPGDADSLDAAPTWRLVIAPHGGTVHLGEVRAGDKLEPDTAVATVVARGDKHEITAKHEGEILEWLVEDGDPVAPGQPLLRVHPTGSFG